MTLKLHHFNFYERVPPAYRNMPEEHGLLRLYMHQSVAVRTDSVRAAAVEMPGKDVLQSSRLVAGRQLREVVEEAGEKGGKSQHAEFAGVFNQRNGRGAATGSLRKGAGWGNAHVGEPRLGQVFVVVSNTLSVGSFFSSLFKWLPQKSHPLPSRWTEAPPDVPGHVGRILPVQPPWIFRHCLGSQFIGAGSVHPPRFVTEPLFSQ